MKYLNYLTISGKMIASLLIYNIVCTFIYYFNILNSNIISIINYIVILLLFFISGFKIGKKNETRGYLNGFAIGIFMTLFFVIFSLINGSFTGKSYIYFSTLIISSIIGGIIGVDRNKK